MDLLLFHVLRQSHVTCMHASMHTMLLFCTLSQNNYTTKMSDKTANSAWRKRRNCEQWRQRIGNGEDCKSGED